MKVKKKGGSVAQDPLTIDALLSKLAKGLKPGETASIPLYKSASKTTSVDAIKAIRAATAEKRLASLNGNSVAMSGAAMNARGAVKATEESFPKIGKFTETVERPDWRGPELRDGRLIHDDVPKVKDDSDEDDPSHRSEAALAEKGGEGGAAPRPKKKRWRRNQPARRHWALLSKAEWFNSVKVKKLKSKAASAELGAEMEKRMLAQQSNRYEGVNEANGSHYVLLAPAAQPGSPQRPALAVSSAAGFVSFAQPAKHRALTMEEGEKRIKSQREACKTGVRARLLQRVDLSAADDPPDPAGPPAPGGGKEGGAAPPPRRKAARRGHDPDDIMADLAFRNAKAASGSSRARKELLNSLGDASLTVDHDGILGGSNDAEFAPRRRFGRFSREDPRVAAGGGQEDEGGANYGLGGGGSKAGGGNDGMAMEEDFYRRDMAAEYDAMDFDVNDLFEDDDVDLEEGAIDDNQAGGGYDHDVDDDNSSEEDDGSDDDGGAAKVWKDMLTEKDPLAAVADNPAAAPGSPPGDINSHDTKPNPAQLETSTIPNIEGPPKKPKPNPEENMKPTDLDEPQEVDANGDRILNKGAIRREIWLHSGSISFKKLKANFNIKTKESNKKHAERKKLFVSICKELCTIRKDPIEGNLMVLKQHYQK